MAEIVRRSQIVHGVEQFCGDNVASVTVDTTVAGSDSIPFERYARGEFTVPTGSSITTLTFYTSHEDADASFVALYDEDNAAVALTVAAARRYPFPATVAGAKYVRMTGNAAGTVTNVTRKG